MKYNFPTVKELQDKVETLISEREGLIESFNSWALSYQTEFNKTLKERKQGVEKEVADLNSAVLKTQGQLELLYPEEGE